MVVVLIIGVLALAGFSKYQDFSEKARRRVCLHNLQVLENSLSIWETTNNIFAENVKAAFGFTPRTGRLTDTEPVPSILAEGDSGAVAAIADLQPVLGGPTSFVNSLMTGPLQEIIRDDKIWVCPSALSQHYSGSIQLVPDDYLDINGGGVTPVPRGGPIGLGGRYLCAIASLGNRSVASPITNGGFPAGWVSNGPVPSSQTAPSPCPQPPFRVFICGSYGTFGDGTGAPGVPGTESVNKGGPVGPDGSSLSRHSSRW